MEFTRSTVRVSRANAYISTGSTDIKHEIDIYCSYILHSGNGGGEKHIEQLSSNSFFSVFFPRQFRSHSSISFLCFFCHLFQLPADLIQMPLLLLLRAFIALMCDDCSVYSFHSSPPSILLNKFSMRKYSIEFAVKREHVRRASHCIANALAVGIQSADQRVCVCVGSSHARDYGDGVEKRILAFVFILFKWHSRAMHTHGNCVRWKIKSRRNYSTAKINSIIFFCGVNTLSIFARSLLLFFHRFYCRVNVISQE